MHFCIFTGTGGRAVAIDRVSLDLRCLYSIRLYLHPLHVANPGQLTIESLVLLPLGAGFKVYDTGTPGKQL